MRKIVFLSILFGLFTFQLTAAESVLYGVIQGDNVNIRSISSVKGQVIAKYNFGDVVKVASISNAKEKIGDFEGYWYKITKGNVTGWVFGKFISEIREDDLATKGLYDILTKNHYYKYQYNPDQHNKIINQDNYILFYDFRHGGGDIEYILKIYKNTGGEPQLVINTEWPSTVSFKDKYVFILKKNVLVVYKTDVYDKLELKASKGKIKLYDRVNDEWINLDKPGLDTYDSYLEFDSASYVLTKHIRDEKNKPMRIEKFKFENDQFNKIE